MQYIPNLLSLSRLLLALLISFLILKAAYLLAFVFAILAALTDLWDGQLARKFKVVSHLGSVLDPIMDKCYLLIITCCLFFDYKAPNLFLYYLLLAWFIVAWARNIAQLLAVPILGLLKIKFRVKARLFAKWATALNMIVLIVIFGSLGLAPLQNTFLIAELNQVLLYLVIIPSLACEVWILITFLPRFIQILLGKHDTFT